MGRMWSWEGYSLTSERPRDLRLCEPWVMGLDFKLGRILCRDILTFLFFLQKQIEWGK